MSLTHLPTAILTIGWRGILLATCCGLGSDPLRWAELPAIVVIAELVTYTDLIIIRVRVFGRNSVATV